MPFPFASHTTVSDSAIKVRLTTLGSRCWNLTNIALEIVKAHKRPSPFTQLMVREGMRSNLTLPLRVDGKPIGVVFFTSATPGAFSEAHVGFLKQIASQLSIVVEKGRWVSELATKNDELEKTNQLLEEAYERLEADNVRKTEELFTARVIQQGFLPVCLPDLPFLEIVCFQKLATFVSGDYYDFFPIDDGKLVIAVGDATGHGVGTSLMVSATKMALRTIKAPDLALKISQINTHLKQINSYPRLNMALYLVELAYDEKSSTMHVRAAGGGMPPLIVVRSNGGVEEILIEGLPLGAMEAAKYRLTEFQLAKSDLLIVMSDGLPERISDTGEQFGYTRMMSEIQKVEKNGEKWF